MQNMKYQCIAITRARVNPFHPRQQNTIAGQAKVKAGVEGAVRRDTPAIRHVRRAGAAEDLTVASCSAASRADPICAQVCIPICACVCVCVCLYARDVCGRLRVKASKRASEREIIKIDGYREKERWR
jgi:hypothetical protein